LGKFVNELSLEDLEKLAEQEVLSKEITHIPEDQMLLFVATFDLRPGKHAVSTQLLYQLYKAWNPNERLLYRQFVPKIRLLFPESSNKEYSHLLLSRPATSIYRESLVKKQSISRKPTWYLRSFRAFCKARHIYPGDLWMEDYILYHLYDFWFNYIYRLCKCCGHKHNNR